MKQINHTLPAAGDTSKSKSKSGMQPVPLIIIGAREDGHAGVVQDSMDATGRYSILGFYDSELYGRTREVFGKRVLGASNNVPPATSKCRHAFVAIGDNTARHKICEQVLALGYTLVTVVHPSSIVSPSAKLGRGVFVGPGACIQHGCAIQDFVIVGTRATVEHDCVVSAGAHIATEATLGERLSIGEDAFIGMGANIIPDLQIGSHSIVGAGAVIFENVKEGVFVTSIPGHLKKMWQWKITDKNLQPEKKPAAQKNIYVSSPSVPALDEIVDRVQDILESRQISNFAKYVQMFESNVKERLQVKYCRAVSNGTTGLALALKILDIKGEVLVPDFTFSATGHVVVWNQCTPVLVDVDPQTFNIDIESARRAITKKTKAILAVHVFGNPCEIEKLQSLCREHNLKLIFDSAHAFGSSYRGRPIGNFGDIEVFSLSGTKALTSGEGGLVTTNSPELDAKMQLARNYGAGPDYNCQFFGFNGKFTEINAVLGLANLVQLDALLKRRETIAAIYEEKLRNVPGIRFQKIMPASSVARSYFAIVLDPSKYGRTRDELYTYLETNNIFPRKYFYPPLHAMKAYQDYAHRALPNATKLSQNILCVPIYPHLADHDVLRIAALIVGFQKNIKKNRAR